MELEITAEDIARHYDALGHSVDLIAKGKPNNMTDEDWIGTRERNKSHLAHMLAKDFWTGEDLSAVEEIVNEDPAAPVGPEDTTEAVGDLMATIKAAAMIED